MPPGDVGQCAPPPGDEGQCATPSGDEGQAHEPVSSPTRARILVMTAPQMPLTHVQLLAKSEARRSHALSRDNSDLCADLHHHVRAIADTASLSPHAANLSMLDAMFGKADVRTDIEHQIQVLLDVDCDGDLDEDPDGHVFTFIKYDGCIFKPGHGRLLCNVKCSRMKDVPHNCGFHQDYIFPISFSPCGARCRGAFCRCIRGGKFDL